MNHMWRILLAASLLLSLLLPAKETAVFARQSAPPELLLENMSVEERIGQLFLVTFRGDSVDQESDIADLILNYKVGGVVLLPENDNISGFGDPADTPAQLAAFNNNLQSLALTGSVVNSLDDGAEADLLPTVSTPTPPNNVVPLLIGMNHEGSPYDPNRFIGGLTAVPTNMSMGATWKPIYAQAVGEIIGRELSAVGVNLLLGPGLDVLENPSPVNPADLGTTTFGGDPYWVGKIGQAYTSGVHNGSNDRVAVIAKHFPGKGSSDRPIEAEIPTVRKSLEQLKQIELAPFMAVTEDAPGETAVADGLLTTHIRYQGFQGNIRATTAPVSFDPQALTTLMQLPEFNAWRNNGGLIVSDSLGVRSVERFYDDTEQEFPHRRVAKDAFLAGNDLLYLNEFALGNAPYSEELANMKDTIVWFREKYETDQTFKQRVDEAVLRILKLKQRVYGDDFSLENVTVDTAELDNNIGQGNPIMFDLAQTSTTLIAPSQSELAERLATLPGAGDNIIVFTDVREEKQCSDCPSTPIISQTALAERMLALYGPDASGQLQANQISSFSFADLEDFLDAGGETIFQPTPPAENLSEDPDATPLPTPTPRPGFLVQEAINDANWIIFGMLNVADDFQALKQFLAQRPDIARNSRVIVFAFDAPYYLDSTEISKLTAYFALYSSSNAFIDAAVRALFQESPLSGKSPVSIEGVSYNLFIQTQPDPQQVIELFISQGGGATQSPQSEAPLDAAIGDTLQLQTGVIRDRNGNQVPDGTIVQFIQQDRIQGTVSIIAEVPTTNGIAGLDYVIEASIGPGQFRITTVSGDAVISQAVDISIEDEAQVAIIVPTPLPTATPSSTPMPTNTPIPSSTPTPPATATPVPIVPPPEPGIRISLSDFQMIISMFMGLALTLGAGILISQRHNNTPSELMGWLLWGVIGGLVVYLYFILGLPGSDILARFGAWAGLLTTVAGGLVGLLLFLIRSQRLQSSRTQKRPPIKS